MTLEDARRFMEERANLTAGTARAEVARYAASPTQASAYLVGCLEILAIRERHLARAGPAWPTSATSMTASRAAVGCRPRWRSARSRPGLTRRTAGDERRPPVGFRGSVYTGPRAARSRRDAPTVVTPVSGGGGDP